MKEFLNQTYFGNTVESYAIALGIFILGAIILTIFKKIVLSRLKKWSEKTETKLDDLLIKGMEKSILPVLYLSVFYVAVDYLSLPAGVEKGIGIGAVILITFFVIRLITSTLRYSLSAYVNENHRAKRMPTED